MFGGIGWGLGGGARSDVGGSEGFGVGLSLMGSREPAGGGADRFHSQHGKEGDGGRGIAAKTVPTLYLYAFPTVCHSSTTQASSPLGSYSLSATDIISSLFSIFSSSHCCPFPFFFPHRVKTQKDPVFLSTPRIKPSVNLHSRISLCPGGT